MNNPNIDISGWEAGYAYQKFDVVFFSGDPQSTTGCLATDSGYYYCDSSHTSSNLSTAGGSSNAPTGGASKWTQEFFFKPGYNSSVTFDAKNYRTDFGDGYFSLIPKSSNSLHANFSLNFDGRNDKEARGIANFLESHSFEALSGAISGVTGFTFESFYPYDKKDEYFCDQYNLSRSFSDVNTISTTFSNEHTSATDWMNRFISSGNTNGLWEVGKTYSIYDTVYHSGGVLGTLSGSDGYYFYTGASSTTSSIANSPSGGGTLWTNDVFFFKPSVVSNDSVPIRFHNNQFLNDFDQRSNDGINTANLKLNVVLANRSNEEAVAISKFLIGKQGYQTFRFTPPEPHNKELNFVCESWRHNYIFDDNHSFELNFEQNPLDLTRKSRVFKTLIASERIDDSPPEILAPYGITVDGASTLDISFGGFMTGFASGTGMWLVNSGEQMTKSVLALSGHEAASGVFKLEDPDDDRAYNFTQSGFTYKLGAGDSGHFDITFTTTGHTGQIGLNAGLGAATTSSDADRIDFSQGRIMYADEPANGGLKESALIITTTDEFFFGDPSGDLKLDLSGAAIHDAAPGAPINVMAKQTPERATITGTWELADPKTATGISVLYSTDDVYYTMLQTGLATGVTTFVHEPVIPGSGYYYRIGASNCDIVGVGTSVGRTNATCAFRDNVATGEASAVVDVGPSALPIVIGPSDKAYNQINISTLASGALENLSLSNADNFTGVEFRVKAGATITSNDPEIPAVQTGPTIQHADGTNLKLRIVVEDGAAIIGAGGRGAEAVRQEDLAFALSTRTSDSVTPLTRSQSRVGSLHELQGVGPVSLWATSGSSEGKYLLPNGYGEDNNVEPICGESGGAAIVIHSSYKDNNQEIEIHNHFGRILGGGGGGGQGGARYNDLPNNALSLDMEKGVGTWKINKLRSSVAPETRSRTTKSAIQVNSVQEIRPGGGGGGGAGCRKNTDNIVGIATNADLASYTDIMEFDFAAGGKGCRANAKYRKTNVGITDGIANRKWGIRIARPSKPGENSTAKFPNRDNLRSKRASEGGAGCTWKYDTEKGSLIVDGYDVGEYTNINVDKLEGLHNGGGQGGFGGGWGMDGGNGEHPQQSDPNRFEEPRNYGYGGSGGMCIEANGARLRFMINDYIPSTGLGVHDGERTDTDAKSSELYRNMIGIGDYVTARASGIGGAINDHGDKAIIYERDAGGGDPAETPYNKVFGSGSGLKHVAGDPGTMDRANSAITQGDVWNAFDQCISNTGEGPAGSEVYSGSYVLLHDSTNGFPYYLTYDCGLSGSASDSVTEDVQVCVKSYTIASAGASPEHYSDKTRAATMFAEVYAPTDWELQATNKDVGLHPNEKDWEILHIVRNDVPRQTSPRPLIVKNSNSTEENDKSYVSIPGLIRSYPINNDKKYRHYRLKINSAEHPSEKKCKIADFGLRYSNRGYAGFISSAKNIHGLD